MLRVLVLGELAVEVDGRPLPLPDGRPARALLGYLALHPGPHARAALAARLWPDVLDESARTSLRGALADVRRALGEAADEHLVATRGEVGLFTNAGLRVSLAVLTADSPSAAYGRETQRGVAARLLHGLAGQVVGAVAPVGRGLPRR